MAADRSAGRRALTIVSVAYPFAPVSADPVGGAEQVLAQLDRALVAAGHRSIVVAVEGSRVAGELRSHRAVSGEIDDSARRAVHANVRDLLQSTIASARPDVVHLHGIDFAGYLPAPGPPVVATLHLPLAWYAPGALAPERPRTWLHPVSSSQARSAPSGAVLADVIENGVDLVTVAAKKRSFALTLGRICPEKGIDDAIAAARRADVPLFIAGTAFPYRDHQRYLHDTVLPGLDRSRRWIGAVAGMQKKRLLAQARCVLVPSKAPETSSLVAMEALAAGTPVIAYRAGALVDIVEHGRTGFLVDGVEAMARAIASAGDIDPRTCRRVVEERFAVERMTGAYLERYRALAS